MSESINHWSSRRVFLQRAGRIATASALAGLTATCARAAEEEPLDAAGVFCVRELGGRQWLIAPEGERFFVLTANHIGAAATAESVSGQRRRLYLNFPVRADGDGLAR